MSEQNPDDKPIIDPWPLGQREPTQRAFVPSIHPSTPDATAAEDAPIANFGWRFLGFLIDGMIVGLVTDAVAVRIAHVNVLAGVGVALLVNFLYASLLIGLWHGQTLGMKIVKVRCVDALTRQAPSPRQAAVRALVAGLFTLPSEFVTIGMVAQVLDLAMPIFDKQNRTIHDKAAHTVVVRHVVPKPEPTITFER
jgi:uncharacterized RDD family membrane protein YckC